MSPEFDQARASPDEENGLQDNVQENQVEADRISLSKETVLQNKRASLHLKTHFDLLYCFGLCPIQGNGNLTGSSIYLMPFLLFSGLATSDAFASVKTYVLLHAQTGYLFDYIQALYLAHGVVKSCYFFSLFFGEKVPNLLNNLSCPVQGDNKNCKTKSSCGKVSKAALYLMVGTTVASMSIALKLDDYFNSDAVFKDLVSSQSAAFSHGIFLWKRTNATALSEELEALYGDSELNVITLAFGCVQILMRFFRYQQALLMNDVMVSASLLVFGISNDCANFFRSFENIDGEVLKQMWNAYESVHKLSKEINNCFGVLFILLHISNWLACAYFLLDCLYGDIDFLYSGVFAVSVVKIVATYYFAVSASTLETKLKEHLHGKSVHAVGNDAERGLKVDVGFIEQKMAVCPVGLGTGAFHVTGTFVLKFIGSVFSCFLLFADSLKD